MWVPNDSNMLFFSDDNTIFRVMEPIAERKNNVSLRPDCRQKLV